MGVIPFLIKLKKEKKNILNTPLCNAVFLPLLVNEVRSQYPVWVQGTLSLVENKRQGKQ